jgi:hypothetical protein
MTTYTSRVNSALLILRRVLGVHASPPSYFLGLILILLFGPSRASADISAYVFSPGTATFLGGEVEFISGSFTFDTATDTESGVSITLTGPLPFSGTYTEPLLTTFNAALVIANAPGEELDIYFADPLSVSPDPLSSVYWFTIPVTEASATVIDPAPLGSAIFVPEPWSVILLVAEVAMVGFLMRRKPWVCGLSKRTSDATAHHRT